MALWLMPVPPLAEDWRPLAVLLNPPLTEAALLLALLPPPPLTEGNRSAYPDRVSGTISPQGHHLLSGRSGDHALCATRTVTGHL